MAASYNRKEEPCLFNLKSKPISINALEAMHTARVTWEEGTLRASNDELYAILEGVYAMYAELKAEVGKTPRFCGFPHRP